MHDTPLDVQERYYEMFRSMSPSERLEMGSRMHGSAKRTIAAAIRRRHPGISPAQLRGQIFLAFYRNDFSDEELQRIETKMPNMEFSLEIGR